MAEETTKESAILAQIAFLEAEKKGEVLRDIKSIPASDRKSIWGATRRRGKLVNTHCVGPGQCKKLTCFHCNCNNHDAGLVHTCGRHSAEDILLYENETKIVDLLMHKCSKDGFSISRNYAISMAASANFKLVLAIEAVKLDLTTREAALKDTGRLAFYTYQDGLIGNCSLLEQQWVSGSRIDVGKRARDEAISAIEKDDLCLLDFVAKGRSSVYGSTILKRLSCQMKVEAAMQLHNIEATLRSDRAAFFRERKQDSIQGEALDDVMREYDRGVVASGKIKWPKGLSLIEAAGLVDLHEGKGKKKPDLPNVKDASNDAPAPVAVQETESVSVIANEDERVSKSYCSLSNPNDSSGKEPLKAKPIFYRKRKQSRKFDTLSTVQEQREGDNIEEADNHKGEGSCIADEGSDVEAKGQAGLESWESALQSVVGCLSQYSDTDESSDGHEALEQEPAERSIVQTNGNEKEMYDVTEPKVANLSAIGGCQTEQDQTEEGDFYKVFSLEYYLPNDEGEKVRKCNASVLHLYHDICDGINIDDIYDDNHNDGTHTPDQQSIDELIAMHSLNNGPLRRCYAERVIQFCSGSAALATHFLEVARENFSELFREQRIECAGPEKYELQGWIFLQAYVKALLDQEIARARARARALEQIAVR